MTVIGFHWAAERYRSVQPGILSRHCFSSGAHYDPANLHFGAVIALDEHVLEGGAGFAEHAHRGVELISWVLDGVLRHEDMGGRVEVVRPGLLQQQLTGSGIRHSETNASASEPLRFVQAWLELPAGQSAPQYRLVPPPLSGRAAQVSVIRPEPVVRIRVPDWALAYVTRGTVELGGTTLSEGDSARISAEDVSIRGGGEVLILAEPHHDALHPASPGGA